MKTILVADDETTIRKIYQQELEEDGYRVLTASTGREAIEAVRRESCDLVIMDIRMPGMDGIEAMHRILEDDNEIPIIINSAFSSHGESFMSWAADAYLIKSSDVTELKETVAKLLDGSREPREACPAAP